MSVPIIVVSDDVLHSRNELVLQTDKQSAVLRSNGVELGGGMFQSVVGERKWCDAMNE